MNSCAAFLNGAIVGNAQSADAGAFFNPVRGICIPPVPIYAENKATTRQAVNRALMKTGVSVYFATPQGRDARMQLRDRVTGEKVIYYDEIDLEVYSIENPKVNATGIDCDQCQAAISYFLPEWNGGLANGVILLKESIHALPPLFKEMPAESMRGYLTRFVVSGSIVLTKPVRI